jgi:P2 family phage contractile tail tube protein
MANQISASPFGEVLKNFNLFIESFGYAGNVAELQPPALTLKTEEHRNGGMDAPVDLDMGMEKLECSFTVNSHDPLALSALGQTLKRISLTFRGAVENYEGGVKAVVIKATGKCIKYEPDAWKAGEKPGNKYTYNLTYYHHTIGGIPVHVIDIPNMVRMIGGIDQLKAQRDAILNGTSVAAVARNIIGI